MNAQVEAALAQIDAAVATIRAAETPPPPIRPTVRAGENLQAALDAGGEIAIEPGAQFSGSFKLWKPGTRLFGAQDVVLIGQRGPALYVPIGASDLYVENVAAGVENYDQAVVRLGMNDSSQTTLSVEPRNITLRRVRIPTFRGKHAFEINARDVTLTECEAIDVWDPGLRDSQGILLMNSSGGLTVRGGRYSAGSECFMSGGDWMKMPGVVPATLVFEGVEFFRPLSWQTDGVNRAVKNLFELKNGTGVLVKGCKLSGSWTAAQPDGAAFMLTPTNRGTVGDVRVEGCVVRDCGMIYNILGRDYGTFSNGRTALTSRDNVYQCDRKQFGKPNEPAQGQLAKIGAEPLVVDFEDDIALVDGSSLIYYYRGTVMNPDGTKRAGGNIGTLRLVTNKLRCGQYGINLDGYANGGVNGEGLHAVDAVEVTGNIFAGDILAPALKKNFPSNVWAPASAAANWV